MGRHRQKIIQLTAAFIVGAGAAANASEVKPYRRPAALHKGPSQGLHDLVVQGAGEQRVWMRNDRHAMRVGRGRIHGDFKRTGRSVNAGL